MVTVVQGRYDVSERYSCRALGFEREGLVVRRRHRKRVAVPRVPRPVAAGPNDTWGIDFVSDNHRRAFAAERRRHRSTRRSDRTTRPARASVAGQRQ